MAQVIALQLPVLFNWVLRFISIIGVVSEPWLEDRSFLFLKFNSLIRCLMDSYFMKKWEECVCVCACVRASARTRWWGGAWHTKEKWSLNHNHIRLVKPPLFIQDPFPEALIAKMTKGSCNAKGNFHHLCSGSHRTNFSCFVELTCIWGGMPSLTYIICRF